MKPASALHYQTGDIDSISLLNLYSFPFFYTSFLSRSPLSLLQLLFCFYPSLLNIIFFFFSLLISSFSSCFCNSSVLLIKLSHFSDVMSCLASQGTGIISNLHCWPHASATLSTANANYLWHQINS